MLILAIETATESVGVALGGRDGVLASVTIARGRRHGETLAPAIQFACRHAGVELPDLDAVAVDIGPGLFTGMRVGLATAKSMAWALDVPVVSATSLEILALATRDDVEHQHERLVCSVVDARKGEVFHQLFRADASGVESLSDPICESPETLSVRLHERSQSVVCVGDGARRYVDQLTVTPRIAVAGDRWDYPSAACLVELAHRRTLRETWTSPDHVEAMYLRQPDAQINWSTRNDGP